jgi:hypothetical protein
MTEVNQQENKPAEPVKPVEVKQVNEIDLDKLLLEIETENKKKLDEVKKEAINTAKEGMVSADTVKQLLTKVNEAHSKSIETLNKQVSELKESVITQKGVAQTTGGNPYSTVNQANYNFWKDPQVPDTEKVQALIRNIRQGKYE